MVVIVIMQLNQYYQSAFRAKIAYLNNDLLKSMWSEKHSIFEDVSGEPIYYNDDKTSTQAYSWIKDGKLYIIFRGTSDLKDVYEDIHLLQHSLIVDNVTVGRVHQGFLACFRSLESELDHYINRWIHNIDTIIFCGHSLGGGIATLASAVYGAKFTDKKIICHTIGSPRVGNGDFVKWYEQQVFESVRIYNKEDPVPLLPASIYYTHVGGGICLTESRAALVNDDSLWGWRLVGYLFTCDCAKSFVHHSCDTYIDRLLSVKGSENTKN